MAARAKIHIDVIILSYANNEELKLVTLNCIQSLVASEDPSSIKFYILVIESCSELKGYQYPFSRTIYPDEQFGFHRYMNLGIRLTSSTYVCLCNNDLLFHKGWAKEIINSMNEYPDLISASPVCSNYHPAQGIILNSGIRFGYKVGVEVAGWCLFVRRNLFNTIGKLDENFMFNAADLDYSRTLEVLNLKHALVTSSIVDHLQSKTLNYQDEERQDELNLGKQYYDKKWKRRILVLDRRNTKKT